MQMSVNLVLSPSYRAEADDNGKPIERPAYWVFPCIDATNQKIRGPFTGVRFAFCVFTALLA